jgi:hypothetical protein
MMSLSHRPLAALAILAAIATALATAPSARADGLTIVTGGPVYAPPYGPPYGPHGPHFGPYRRPPPAVVVVEPAPPPVVVVQPAPVAATPAPAPTAQPYCREFQTQTMVGGQPQPSYGTACQQPDGSWKIVSQKP